ncbi:SDR family NAD(P)-dependent oxidoreductase [Amycolatopsis sp. NBC_00345]|uniref:SDR family NAD(P)-dependent oxidoreductase n=1 Tax=Amycolatopsis sp. NBC_00345 TaxID=2975955 RepID=UPI002E255590
MNRPLAGKTAVVTGASRGVGKGVALELGAAGATVYVTGRSTSAGPLPGTIGETADEVTALGGTGVAVLCDHHDDSQVEAVFARVREERGSLDVLVNNVFSASDLAAWINRPFWELPVAVWDEVVGIGARSHYVASVFAAPLLFAAGRGLIVNVSSSGAAAYQQNTVYGVGKAAVDKMTADLALELRPHDVAVVSVWPGLVRTELLALGARAAGDGRAVLEIPGSGLFDIGAAESPRFVGRGITALAADPAVMTYSGGVETTPDLAVRYGFTDVDGTLPGEVARG